MLVLGMDLETTGLSFEKDRITELGAVLWDTDKSKPMRMYSAFINHPARPKISQEIEDLTGINEEDLAIYGIEFEAAYKYFLTMANQADYIVAHNGSMFDKPMLEAHCTGFNLAMPENAWLDTSKDVPYPESMTTRRLSYLATEHNFLNPFPHRAVFDVLTMLKILGHYSIEDVISYSKMKDVTLRALVTFHQKELAKESGYRWHAEEKVWIKTVKEDKVEAEIKKAKFQVAILEK